jgi:hypothetical protein
MSASIIWDSIGPPEEAAGSAGRNPRRAARNHRFGTGRGRLQVQHPRNVLPRQRRRVGLVCVEQALPSVDWDWLLLMTNHGRGG